MFYLAKGPLTNHEGFIEAEDDNDVRENASDGESKSLIVTSPSHQSLCFRSTTKMLTK